MYTKNINLNTKYILLWISRVELRDRLTQRFQTLNQPYIEHFCIPDEDTDGSQDGLLVLYEVNASFHPKSIPQHKDHCAVLEVEDHLYYLYNSIREWSLNSNSYKIVAPQIEKLLVDDNYLKIKRPYKYITFWYVAEEQIDSILNRINQQSISTVLAKKPSYPGRNEYVVVFTLDAPISEAFALSIAFEFKIRSMPQVFIERSELLADIETYNNGYIDDLIADLVANEREQKIDRIFGN